MARQRVDVPPKFLRILAVISLGVGEPEETLFQNGIASIPKCECETEVLILVAPTCESIFAPSIGAAARVIVRKRIPRGAIG